MNLFLIGSLFGFFMACILFFWVLKDQSKYYEERIEYWYKSSKEYLNYILKYCSHEERRDPADWWKN